VPAAAIVRGVAAGTSSELQRVRVRSHVRLALVLACATMTPHIGLAQMTPAVGEPEPVSFGRIQALLARADERALHEDPGWLALLHYDRGLGGSRHGRSRALTKEFFLAGDGDEDPRAELRATVRSFFDANAVVKGDEHPQCAFVARRHWIERELGSGAEIFPPMTCAYYERWRAGLDARGLTLIFPEAFMNNPASMFGHTLLRVDGAEGADGVLGYAVDFTANTGGDSVPLYMAKGALGFYPALFGVRPYYEQLKRYSDWENRDIWEYRLNVTADELDVLLMHLWELRGIEFPYYFFTKNCSYELLRLLDIGVPDLHAAARFRGPVIPADTVKVLAAKPGFIGDVRYLPSPETSLRATLAGLAAGDRRRVRDIVAGRLDPADSSLRELTQRRHADVLDAAYDQLRYQYLAGQVTEEASRNLSRRILIARSHVGARAPGEAAAADEIEAPDARPDQGHDSRRIALALGWRDDETFVDVEFRPALHSLLDDGRGYPEHLQIEFLTTRMRIYPESGAVRLQELTLIDMLSLSPRSRVFRPWSWGFRTGLATRRVPDRHGLDDAAVWGSEVDVGLAWDPLDGLLLYGLVGGRFDVGPDLDDDVNLGPGGRLGALLGPDDARWKGNVFGGVGRVLVGETTTQLVGGVELRLSTSRNTALVAGGSAHRVYGESWLEGRLRVDLHF